MLFRSTISNSALIGGGAHAKPGVISLSHRGVLFLDELTQFPRQLLETLRQPIENHEVTITRINGNYKYPAHFMLVAAMNPCKCGYYPDLNKCSCTTSDRKKYISKISGPIIDRIDLFVNTDYIELSAFQTDEKEEGSITIKQRIERAIAIQNHRFQNTSYLFNSEIEGCDVEKFCKLNAEAKELMNMAYVNLQLTGRSYHRILKVARTIADLSESDEINILHLSEALSYRDRKSVV